MNETLDIYGKCILLIYLEYKNNKSVSNVKDLVEDILTTIDLPKNYGRIRDLNIKARSLINGMLDNPELYNEDTLPDSIKIIFREQSVLDYLIDKIKEDIKEEKLISLVNVLSLEIKNWFRENKIKALLQKTNIELNKNMLSNGKFSNYIKNLISNLEKLNVIEVEKDQSVIREIDVSNPTNLEVTLNRVTENKDQSMIFKSGWEQINRMVQGGFRKKEMWVIGALQHSYKSGFLQSLFCQFCLHNTPIIKPNKKPCIMYISLEDTSETYLEFIYRYLYTNEKNEEPDIKFIKNKEKRTEQLSYMSSYITEKLTKTGFTPLLMELDPTQCSVEQLINILNNKEKEGYDIQAVILDYLYKIPVEANNLKNSAEMVQVMYQQIRSYITKKNMLLITAHQLSTEAKSLTKGGCGLIGIDFLQEVSNKGYYEASKRLDQVVDGEIYLNKFEKDKVTYLAVMRGKHRIPTILPKRHLEHIFTFKPGFPLQEKEDEKELEFD